MTGEGDGPTLALVWSQAARTNSATMPTTRSMWSNRSEEHTSELQSRLHLVCRLLLEKKNQQRVPLRRIGVPARRRLWFFGALSVHSVPLVLSTVLRNVDRARYARRDILCSVSETHPV